MLIVYLYVDDFIFTGDFGIEEFNSVMKDGFGAYEIFFGY